MSRESGFISRGENKQCGALYPHIDYKIKGRYYCTVRLRYRYPNVDDVHRREVYDPGMVTPRTEFKIAGEWRES